MESTLGKTEELLSKMTRAEKAQVLQWVVRSPKSRTLIGHTRKGPYHLVLADKSTTRRC